jgi:hypothetical protein
MNQQQRRSTRSSHKEKTMNTMQHAMNKMLRIGVLMLNLLAGGPVWATDNTSGVPVPKVPAFAEGSAFGGGLRAVPNASWWSKLTFKAELVYKLPYGLDGVPEVLPDDYLQYVVGFDRIFSGALLSTDQLTLTVEYISEHLADDQQSRFLFAFFPNNSNIRGELRYDF